MIRLWDRRWWAELAIGLSVTLTVCAGTFLAGDHLASRFLPASAEDGFAVNALLDAADGDVLELAR